MKKKKRMTNREFFEKYGERFARTDRLLRERIEYHRAKLIEERPGWDAPKTDAEWMAYHEARIDELIRQSEQK